MGIVLDPTKCLPSHPSEEILEEYAFHRLPEALAAQVEEHLLICHSCQDAVAETDRVRGRPEGRGKANRFPPSGRLRLAELSSPALPRRRVWRRSLPLVILALVVVWKQPQETSTPVAVSLSSLRGLSPLAPAPAGKPLRFNIDLPDLAPGREYRVEVVDAAGSPVWKGAVSDIDGKLAATMSKPLRKGVYWVRLYGADSELLREFGMSAK